MIPSSTILAYLLAGVFTDARAQISNDAVIGFPGDPKFVALAQTDYEVSYSDPGKNEYGYHEYKLNLTNKKSGTQATLMTFTREVEIGANSTGHGFYVNNYVGSNLSNCIIYTNPAHPDTSIDVTSVLLSDGYLRPPENPDNSHFNLSCTKWRDGDVLVDLQGVTDAGGTFRYSYVFSVSNGKLSLAPG